MYKVGDTFMFTPSAYTSSDNGTLASKERREQSQVLGTVVHVSTRGRWYRASYQTAYYGTQYECFKF